MEIVGPTEDEAVPLGEPSPNVAELTTVMAEIRRLVKRGKELDSVDPCWDTLLEATAFIGDPAEASGP